MFGQMIKTSRSVTCAGLIGVMVLGACDEQIALAPEAVSAADSCSSYREQIAQARRTDLDKQAEGAAVGAVVGALLGAAVAGSGNRAEGAILGAIGGGLVGYSAVYSQQVTARSSDAENLLSNVNSDAGQERALLTSTGKAAVGLQNCRRSQLASLSSRVKSGKTSKSSARAELNQIKSWVLGDNQIVSGAFNGIGKRVDAYVDVTDSTASTQRNISAAGAKKRTPNVTRVKAEKQAVQTTYASNNEAVAQDIEILDTLLG